MNFDQKRKRWTNQVGSWIISNFTVGHMYNNPSYLKEPKPKNSPRTSQVISRLLMYFKVNYSLIFLNCSIYILNIPISILHQFDQLRKFQVE